MSVYQGVPGLASQVACRQSFSLMTVSVQARSVSSLLRVSRSRITSGSFLVEAGSLRVQLFLPLVTRVHWFSLFCCGVGSSTRGDVARRSGGGRLGSVGGGVLGCAGGAICFGFKVPVDHVWLC